MKGKWRDTLNLPKTEFPMRANLPKREPNLLQWWQEQKIYEKMLAKHRQDPTFILHDGPPYSNGHLHLGHAVNKVLKDLLVKYKALQGHYTPFVPGWDNHGMPIERAVVHQDPEFAEVRHDHEKLRDPQVRIRIREKCRAFAQHWVEIQRKEFVRLGVFGDWEKPYLTMSPEFEGGEIEIFADLVEQGYVYRGRMPIHWCPSCRTALAMIEVEYYEKESPSLFFWVPVRDTKGVLDPDVWLVVWTTTPWTLIANRAFAFHPDYDYVVAEVETARGEHRKVLFAERLLPVVAEIVGWTSYRKLRRIPGRQLEGLTFAHPIFEDRTSPAILADFVTLTEGTGVVHIAPGHGKEDFEIGRKYDLEVFSPVDEAGRFTAEAGPEFQGLFVGKEGSEKAVEVLKRRGHFLHRETLRHTYPHCWRCKSPLIFRATTQWFLSVDHQDLRHRALKAIESVRWHPPETINRIYNSVKERPDWVLSRQRAWGVNIPVFYCEDCGEPLVDPRVMRHVARIFKQETADAWYRRPVQDLLPPDTRCPHCGGTRFRREDDILDVWFDSGATNLIVLREENGLRWPSDVYLEGSDQHRGWFNSSLMLAMAERGQPPYRAVITHGWTLDEQGRAMHKSLGNVISPQEVIDRYGADVLRLWVTSSDYTEDIRLGPEILARMVDSYRKIRNTYRFMLGNLYDFDPARHRVPYSRMKPLDRFLLHQYSQLLADLERFYENFEFHRVFHRYFNFVVVDLSAFYLDVVKDRLYTWAPDAPERRSAQTVIYELLRGLLVAFAPVLSFTTEEAWQLLPGNHPESVFLADWPRPEASWHNETLAQEFQRLLEVREVALRALETARKDQKLIQDRLEAELLLETQDPNLAALLDRYAADLPEFFVVSGVRRVADLPAETPVVEAGENLRVGVRKKAGQKCARCWMWYEAVGQHPEYPDLCPKCIRAVESLRHED